MSDIGLSVGIVMDGNRRWATKQSLPAALGHEEGAKRVHDVVTWAVDAHVSHLYLYAFSTENWNRTAEEVDALMQLLERAFSERMRDIEALGARIRFIGERQRLRPTLQELCSEVERRSSQNTTITVVFCLSYGGRNDIAQAVSRIPKDVPVTEEIISRALSTAGMPNPDPGGEQRLSNFLIWESAYAELFFTPTLWPDFTKEEFSRILEAYALRKRRMGT
jgi:undecaprenyl diphosphate synthase